VGTRPWWHEGRPTNAASARRARVRRGGEGYASLNGAPAASKLKSVAMTYGSKSTRARYARVV
jgi:hypothetical protein